MYDIGSLGLLGEHRAVFNRPRRTRRHNPYQQLTGISGRYQQPTGNVLDWTRKYFCFSSVSARTVPMSRVSKRVLASMGLGERTLSIASNATSTQLHQLIVDNFPPLLSCGGYSLLRCDGKTKVLELIEPPSGGHTPMSIESVIGQSRIYIRPLQQDIQSVGEVQVRTV